MAKTIQVFVNTGNEDTNQAHAFVQGSGDKGKSTRIKAVKGARYQLKDPALKDVGPEYIRSKRVGKNLHVSLEGSNQADLIIEGYYDEGYLAQDNTGLYGRAEDGQLYEYIPEDPTTAGLSANLIDGAVPVSQVLGGVPYGEAFALSALPLVGAAAGGFAPLLVGAGLLGAAALAANRNSTPAAPSGQTGGLSSDSDSGSNNADGITNNKTPSYSGKAAAGSTVEVTINGKTYTTTADANGNYTVKIPAGDALPDGTYTPKIKVTNANGTTTVDGTPFTIDTTTTGTGGLTHDAANDSGSSLSDGITTNTKPSFSGTGEPGATVKIVVDGQTLTAVVGADGKWVASGPYTGNGLTGGQHAVVITFTDVAGNTSTVNAAPVFISTGIANITLSVDAVTVDNTIGGAEASANGNTDITGKASGDFKAGQIVTLTINGKTFSGPVDATGAYKISVPTADLLADSDKTIAASIAVTDAAGNSGTVSTTHIYLVDNTAPNANTTTLIIDSVTADNIVVGAENTPNARTNITGKAFGEFQVGDIVTLTINGKTFTGAVAADGSYSIPVPVADLVADSDAKIDATLAATDHAGNKGSIAAAHTYVTDTLGPNNTTTALVLDPVTPDNLISGLDTDTNINVTGKASGEFKAGDVVFFTLNGHSYTGTVLANGNFTISVAKTDLIGNTSKIINASLLATDANGNQGTVTTDHTYAVDTTGPSATTTSVTVNPVTADNLINATEAGQPSIAITGRVTGEYKAGDIVTLTVNGKPFTGPATADGSYSINVTTTDLVADATRTITSSVVAHDAAGNAGNVVGNSQTYLVDNAGPSSNGTTLIIDAVTTDNIVNIAESQNTNTPITGKVVGEFTAGDVVTLTINGHTYNAQVASNGTYSTSVLTSDLTGDSAKTITASIAAHDAVGNTGTISATRPYIVDVTAPNTNPGTAAINVDPVTADNLINSADAAIANTTITGTVTGEFKAGDIVTLTFIANGITKTYTGPVTLATGSAVGTYSISVLTSDLLSDSDKTITASVAAHDAADNVGTVSTTQTYLVDIVNPSAAGTALSLNPVTADNIINAAESGQPNTTITGTVTGVFTVGDIVTLTVNGKSFTGSVAAGGTYTIPVTTSDLLADPDKTIAASIVAHSSSNNAGTITDTQTYTVDITPPSATTTTLTVDVVTPDNIVNGIEGAAGAADIAITGKAAGTFTAGDIVTLTINNKTFTGQVAADGSYSINVPAADLVNDSDKTIAASIAAHDAAGNPGTVTSARTYAVDTVAPSSATTALAIDPVTADNIINATESGIANTTVTGKATGEFKAGDTVTLTIHNNTYTTTVNAAGNFTVSVLTADLAADADKNIAGTIAATDAAGNVAAAGTITANHLYVVDTTPPANTALRIDAVTADDIINATEAGAANLAITGKATGEFVAGDIVTLTVNGKPFTGTVDASGNYSINVPTADLRADPDLKIDGAILAHDTAGNSANFTATRPYLVDTTGPSSSTTALSVNVVATDDTINAAEAGQTSTPVTGKATGEFVAGDVVTLTVNGKPFTGTVDASGNYSINVPTADLIADTGKTIAASIVAHDAVGNAGTVSAAHPYLVDTVAPSSATTAISVNVVTPDNIINSAEAAVATTAVTGIVSGEYTAGDIVTITVNGHTATGTVAADGTYTVNVLSADLVAETAQTLTASVAAHDAAGNVGSVSTNHRYVVDTTAPNGGVALGLTIDTDTNNDGTINYTELNGATTLNVTATFDKTKVAVGDIVTFTPVGGTAQTVALTQAMVDAGKVTVAFATPANGSTLDVTATLSDVAGNATVPATDSALINSTNPNATATIDITAITTDSGTVGDFITNDTTLTYSGSLTGFTLNGNKVKVELLDASGNVVETQTVTPTSATTWTFTPTAAQASGNYTLRATIVDAAGARVNATAPVNGTGGGQDTQVIVIDTAAPSVTVNITQISEDTGVSNADFITKDNNGLTVSATLSTALLTGEKLFYSRDNGVTWTDITSSVSGTTLATLTACSPAPPSWKCACKMWRATQPRQTPSSSPSTLLPLRQW
jgi:large repetitive protein